MSLTAVTLVLLSATIHVVWNVLTKSSVSPKAFSLIKGTFLIIISICVLPVFPLHSIPTDVWIYVGLSGVIHGVYIWALSTAYETGDISFVYPLSRSAPAFVPITAFLILGERISLRGGFGIAIVVICVFLMHMRKQTISGPRPFWASVRQKDSIWAFVTLGSVVVTSLIDKAGMMALARVSDISGRMHGPVYFMLQTMICYLLFWIYMGFHRDLGIKPIWRHEWLRAMAAAIGTLASYSLILHVMKTENVSYIVTLRQSSVLFAVLIGWLALKEPHGRLRMAAAVAMIVGFFLIATAR